MELPGNLPVRCCDPAKDSAIFWVQWDLWEAGWVPAENGMASHGGVSCPGSLLTMLLSPLSVSLSACWLCWPHPLWLANMPENCTPPNKLAFILAFNSAEIVLLHQQRNPVETIVPSWVLVSLWHLLATRYLCHLPLPTQQASSLAAKMWHIPTVTRSCTSPSPRPCSVSPYKRPVLPLSIFFFSPLLPRGSLYIPTPQQTSHMGSVAQVTSWHPSLRAWQFYYNFKKKMKRIKIMN